MSHTRILDKIRQHFVNFTEQVRFSRVGTYGELTYLVRYSGEKLIAQIPIAVFLVERHRNSLNSKQLQT